jgi:hypothetical protein
MLLVLLLAVQPLVPRVLLVLRLRLLLLRARLAPLALRVLQVPL